MKCKFIQNAFVDSSCGSSVYHRFCDFQQEKISEFLMKRKLLSVKTVHVHVHVMLWFQMSAETLLCVTNTRMWKKAEPHLLTTALKI